MADHYPKVYLYKRIVAAKLFMDHHFSGPIDLDNIADEAHFSKFHFIRLFKMMYGKTPHQYLTAVRIQKAKALLQKGLSIRDTCFEVGYDSAGSFTSLFKRLTGQTPLQYQHRYLQRQQLIKDMPIKFIPACFAHRNGWL